MTNAVTGAELVQRLRNVDVSWSQVGEDCAAAADRIEQLAATCERLEAALHNCVGMLDQLVAESGRDIEWDAEDPFRRGEWFEPEDLAQIEQARATLKSQSDEFAKQKGADHE